MLSRRTKVILLMALCIGWLGWAEGGKAADKDMELFEKAFKPPEKLRNCIVCHIGRGGGRLNKFAEDYNKFGRNKRAFQDVAERDSDKDGVKNIDEIKAGTNPGDSEDSPLKTKPETPKPLPKEKPAYTPKPGEMVIYDGDVTASPVGLRVGRWGSGDCREVEDEEYRYRGQRVLHGNILSRYEGFYLAFDKPVPLTGGVQNYYLVWRIRFPAADERREAPTIAAVGGAAAGGAAAGQAPFEPPGGVGRGGRRVRGRRQPARGEVVGMPGGAPAGVELGGRTRRGQQPPPAGAVVGEPEGAVPGVAMPGAVAGVPGGVAGVPGGVAGVPGGVAGVPGGVAQIPGAVAGGVVGAQTGAGQVYYVSELRLLLETTQGWRELDFQMDDSMPYAEAEDGWIKLSFPLEFLQGGTLGPEAEIKRITVTGDVEDEFYIGQVVILKDEQPLKANIRTNLPEETKKVQRRLPLTFWVEVESGGSLYRVKWDFDKDDGVDPKNPDAEGKVVAHSFEQVGVYTVTAIVEDIFGIKRTAYVELSVDVK